MNKELSALQAMEAEMTGIPGHVGFYYKNLVTGFTYGVRAEETFLAASVIKFPLLLHVDEIICQKQEVNIPWEDFTFTYKNERN